MLRRAGLEDTGLSSHSMRHSFACWHIVCGRNPKSIQQQLGHATITITITYDVYGDGLRLHDEHAVIERSGPDPVRVCPRSSRLVGACEMGAT
jgi:integrase